MSVCYISRDWHASTTSSLYAITAQPSSLQNGQLKIIFHRFENDHDLISTMKFLQENWCRDSEITYEWVKGHAGHGNEDPDKEERLNIEADVLCDVIRNEAT
jgi:ribonuclease HI